MFGSRKTVALSLTCLLAASALAAETKDRATLLAVECERSAEGTCSTQHLVALHFADGALVSKETIVTTNVDEVRFDLGTNRLYRNRYVITEWGDVIDVERKEVLHEGLGQYVAAEGDRIVSRVHRQDVEGIFAFDLGTKAYERLEVAGLPGERSPDRTRSVTAEGGELRLHRSDGTSQLLGSDFTGDMDFRSSGFSRGPVLWLDDARILTQRDNGKLVVVRLDGSVSPLVNVPTGEAPLAPPQLYRDRDGRIVYECGDDAYAIDAERKRFTRYKWLALGHDFDAEKVLDPSHGTVVRHRGKEIGRFWTYPWGAPTTDGWVAFEYGEPRSNLRYPKGMKVWSRASGQWITVDVPWLTALVGWVE